MAHEVLIDDIFVLEGSLGQLLEVDRQVLQVPAVLLDLAQLDALDGVRLQHAPDKVFAVGWDLRWHPVVPFLNLHEQESELLIIERERTAYHGVQDNATAPNVDLLPRVGLAADDFGCCIVRRAARSA